MRSWAAITMHFQGDYGEALRAVAPALVALREQERVDGLFLVHDSLRGPALHVRARSRRSEPGEIEASLARALRPLGLCAPGVYLAEVERYGGASGIVLAESVFEASTEALLRASLSGHLGSAPERLRAALLAAMALAVTVHDSPGSAATFFARWLLSWLSAEGAEALSSEEARTRIEAVRGRASARGRRVQEAIPVLWQQQVEGLGAVVWVNALQNSLRGCIDEHRRAMEAGDLDRSWFEDVSLPSYLHMSHHRHWLLRIDEVYLAYLLATGLGGEATVEQALRSYGHRVAQENA